MNLLLDWTWESLPKIPGKNTNVHKVIHYNSFVVIVKRKRENIYSQGTELKQMACDPFSSLIPKRHWGQGKELIELVQAPCKHINYITRQTDQCSFQLRRGFSSMECFNQEIPGLECYINKSSIHRFIRHESLENII